MKTVSLDAPIRDKIAWAEECYNNLEGYFCGDKQTSTLLKKLKQAVKASRTEMAGTGIINICANCENEDGGSCCGAGIENKYSGQMILINRLLDCDVPGQRHDPGSCFFLGERGCLLIARHVICINYICRAVTEKINPQNISELRSKEGDELDILFLLNERIRFLLNKIS